MNFCFFYHSLVSDWNHGNAHFLRGVVSELQARGHRVRVFEPEDGWSRENLITEYGTSAIRHFQERYPDLRSTCYDRESLNLEKITAEADVILVHEWNEPWLVNTLGELRDKRRKNGKWRHQFRLLFHDTHHRSVSDPAWLKRFRLDCYDGILVFGRVLGEVYRRHGWNDAVWTWHEAADTRLFRPQGQSPELPSGDLVWVGNWGDDERTRELEEFVFRPVQALGLSCHLYGVRYPEEVIRSLKKNVHYCGWLPNYRVPEVFANHAVTVHVPRRYYAETLPGIPTIRPFEAMACGIPLVTSPWQDSEGLFQEGKDYLVARNAKEMQAHLATILNDHDFARHLAAHALATIRVRHTCGHRVDQLLEILATLDSHDRKAKAPDDAQKPGHQPRKRRSIHDTAKP